jgi:hypothetical protein
MCDPTQLNMFSSGMSAGGQVAGGLNARARANYEAQLLTLQAANERSVGAAQAEKIRLNAKSNAKDALAQSAASGLDVNSGGSVEDTQRQITKTGEQDAFMAMLTQNRTADAMEQRAALARREGSNALINGGLGALGTIAGGYYRQSRWEQMRRQRMIDAGEVP